MLNVLFFSALFVFPNSILHLLIFKFNLVILILSSKPRHYWTPTIFFCIKISTVCSKPWNYCTNSFYELNWKRNIAKPIIVSTSCTPSKDFQKIGHKNAIKHENRRPPRFSHNPKYPPQNNLKTTVHCASSLKLKNCLLQKAFGGIEDYVGNTFQITVGTAYCYQLG